MKPWLHYMNDWLLLIYKVPPNPTANRVYVWRKLKQLGALLLHDAVWVLPGVYRLQITELTGTPILLSMDVQTLPGEVTEVQVLTAP